MPKLKVQWDRFFIFRHWFKDLISQRNRLYKPGILQWQKEITTLSIIVLKAGILFFNGALRNAKFVISWTLIELTIIPKHQLGSKWEITAWMLTFRKRGREQIPIWMTTTWKPNQSFSAALSFTVLSVLHCISTQSLSNWSDNTHFTCFWLTESGAAYSRGNGCFSILRRVNILICYQCNSA